MASVANKEDIPLSLDPFRDSPLQLYSPHSGSLGSIPPLHTPISHSIDETPSKSYINTPINTPYPLGLSTYLSPASDTPGINLQDSNSQASRNNIQFTGNINPGHRSIIEAILKTDWSSGDLEGQENSIVMDHSGIPMDSPPLASSTPAQISILPYEGSIHSGDLIYDKKTKLFENHKQDGEQEQGMEQTSAKNEDDNRSVINILGEIEFVPEGAGTSQNVTMEDAEAPVPVPTTPTMGLRRALTRAQSTIKKATLQEEVMAFPQTEPRRPVKAISKTPIQPLDAPALYKAGNDTGNTHRTWGWYDSTSFSSLDCLKEVGTPVKKTGKGKGSEKGKNAKTDELMEEKNLPSEGSEEIEESENNEGSDFECSGDEGDNTPSKKPKTAKGKNAGRKPGKGEESSSEEEPEGGEDNEPGDEEEEKPAPKKHKKSQVAPKNRRKKQKNEDEGAFKPKKDSSDVEEEYETSKPKRGRKSAKVEETVDNDEENMEGVEGVKEKGKAASRNDTNQESSDKNSEDDESEEEEGGNNGIGSGSGSDDGDDGNGNNQSGSEEDHDGEEEDEDNEEEEEEEEEKEEQTPQGSVTVAHTPGTKKNIGSLRSSIPNPNSLKSYDKHLMKRMSVESQRSKTGEQSGLRKAQADKAFEIQEQFKRDGSLREVQLSGFVPSESGWGRERTKKVPPAPPTFKFPETAEGVAGNEGSSQVRGPSKTKRDVGDIERRTERVFPITQKELETAIATIKNSDEALRKAESKGEKYRLKKRRAAKKIASLQNKVRKLEEELEEAGSDCAQLELKLAARNAIGHDTLSYLYKDPEVDYLTYGELGLTRGVVSDEDMTTSRLRNIGGAPLDVQKFDRPPFHSPLKQNPFRHEAMYQRREIINSLTFPGNVMLIDHGTDYFFVCCFCSKVSPVNLLFFQDEIVWLSLKCLVCDAHNCCVKCKRWTAPKPSSNLPGTSTAIELLNGPKGKDSYESSLYLRGIWCDYLRQKKDLKISDEDLETSSEASFGTEYPDEGLTWETTDNKSKHAGLRSVGKRKGGNEEGAHESKRRRIGEILEKRRVARQLPLPDAADEGDEEYDEDGDEYNWLNR
ncbi:hypothetical protein TWF718_004748 [Orbilia javanica]|uniref:Uncharacterized protein n=1 Tax=Orbilia javanica TaxID=47235 RepID=A0AAN8NZZ5_9PEZI